MEEEHALSGVETDVKGSSSTQMQHTENVEMSPPSKSKAEVTRLTDESSATKHDNDIFGAPSNSSAQSDSKNISVNSSKNRTDTTTIESSPTPSKPKSKKKKKKKVSRNDDSNAPDFLSDDKSSNGMDNATVLSTTSSKMKSKGTKKKKKKISTNDEGESVISVSSEMSGKKSSQKKKKKKKISKDDEVDDVIPESSARSLMTSSVKSSSNKSTSRTKSKSSTSVKSPKSAKSKKKKVKSSKIENKPTIPDIERTKSLPDQLSQTDLKRTKSLDLGLNSHANFKKTKSVQPDQQPDLIVKRSMSMDHRFRPAQPIPAGRPNSQRENGMNGNNWTGRGRAHGGRGRGPPVAGRGRGRGRGRGLPPGSWASRSQRPPERMMEGRDISQERSPYNARGVSLDRSPFGARSPSQERSPHSGMRATNGRGPTSRGRRRMSFTQSMQSPNSRGNIYRAPSRPKSILRNSSHHGLHGSSHHRNDRSIATSSSHSNTRRVSMDLSGGSRHSYNKYDPHSSFGSEIDSSDVESDDDSSFALEDSSKQYQEQVPRSVARGFSRTLSGLGNNSSHHGLSHFKATGQSTRSLLTIERSEYHDDSKIIRALRYIHFLAPHPNEDPIKKRIRIITWIALLLDFLNSLVAILTFGGETTQCCKQSILSALSGGKKFPWDQTIFIITCCYMALIFLEVVPVMRDAFPFNLLNPFIGFVITFAVFFSDSITETAIMWTVEAMAVGCEALVYRLRVQRFGKRKARLKNTKKEIEKLRKLKRKVKTQFDNGGGKILARADSAQFVLDLDDSSSFAEDSSFFDDVEHNSGDANTVASRTALTNVSNIGTARETRLLRERRQLIRSQAEDEHDLRIHFIGVSSNIFLVVFSLLMIIIIAKNGGMCIVGMQLGNIFKNNQLEKCNLCPPTGDSCEQCNYDDPTQSQCYYPYGIGM